jgi:hypothetical protein
MVSHRSAVSGRREYDGHGDVWQATGKRRLEASTWTGQKNRLARTWPISSVTSWPIPRRGCAAAVSLAAIVLLVAVAGFPSGSSSAAATLTTTQFTNSLAVANPASPELRRLQGEAWLSFGGKALALRLGRYITGIAAELPGLQKAARSGTASARFRVAAGPIARACRGIGQVVTDADRYFPVPDPPLQEIWAAVLVAGRRGAADCQRGLQAGNATVFNRSLRELAGAAALETKLIHQFVPGVAAHA